MSYTTKLANPTGGKAGRGFNRTSTVQVFQGRQLVKSFRFTVGEIDSLRAAKAKAAAFIAAKGVTA